MSDEPISLELVIEEADKAGIRRLGRIPANIWKIFTAKCAEIMPEKDPAEAWASFLSEIITQHVRLDRFSFIMTGIPIEARNQLDMICSQANLDIDGLISHIFNSALHNMLHLLNITPPESHKGYRVLVVTGLTNDVWSLWAEFAGRYGDAIGRHVSPEEFIGIALEKAATGEMTITNLDANNNLSNSQNNPGPINPIGDDFETLDRQANELLKRMEQLKNARAKN